MDSVASLSLSYRVCVLQNNYIVKKSHRISQFATARIGDSAYIFGGFDGVQDVDDVARLSLTLECPASKPDCGDDDKIRVKGRLVLTQIIS